LTLIYDAPTENELDNPDNLVVTPRGGLLFCEDNSGSPSYLLNGVNTERLVGLTREGEIFTFATNLMDFTGHGNGAVPAGQQRRGVQSELPGQRMGGGDIRRQRSVVVRQHSNAWGDIRHHGSVVARSAVRAIAVSAVGNAG
jgi:secreted PhoX family phosphatase